MELGVRLAPVTKDSCLSGLGHAVGAKPSEVKFTRNMLITQFTVAFHRVSRFGIKRVKISALTINVRTK